MIWYHYNHKFKIMLDFCKKVLLKVSFDKKLFRKELLKAIVWLKGDDVVLLRVWCLATFGHIYRDVILEVFEQLPLEQVS